MPCPRLFHQRGGAFAVSAAKLGGREALFQGLDRPRSDLTLPQRRFRPPRPIHETPQTRLPSGITSTRLTGFEPVTFGFVDRSSRSAGLRGARFQADSARSGSAEIGWNLWGMLPHLLPQERAQPPGRPSVKPRRCPRPQAPRSGPRCARGWRATPRQPRPRRD